MPYADREGQLAYWREYGRSHRDKTAANSKRHYDRHKDQINDRRRESGARRTPDERERAAKRYVEARTAIFAAYGSACACCGSTFVAHLSIDHVYGGGHRDRARNGGNRNVYARIVKEGFPADYQILCFNCNHAKHILGRCPCSDADGGGAV